MWPKNYAELGEKISTRIEALRFHTAPDEACGLVFPNGHIVALTNYAEEPSHEYLMKQREISRCVEYLKMNPVAIFHTHWETDAYPSEADSTALRQLASVNIQEPIMFIYGKDGLRGWTWDNRVNGAGVPKEIALE